MREVYDMLDQYIDTRRVYLRFYHVLIVFSIAVTTIRTARESTSEKISFSTNVLNIHRDVKV